MKFPRPPGSATLLRVVLRRIALISLFGALVASGEAQTNERALVQEAFLKAANAEMGDFYGWSVVIEGGTAVVGAVGEDSDGSSPADNSERASGAVYVFVKSGGNWVPQAYLKAAIGEVEDSFGLSLALSGDTLVIGAPYEDSASREINGDATDNLASDAGAAYVFTRSGSIWTQQAYLKASNADPEDQFGHSVAIEGDFILVGAWLESGNAVVVDGDQSNNDAPEAGAVYAFARTGSTWAQSAYLKAPNSGEGDWFGVSLDLDGGTAVIGALFEDSDATGVDGDGAGNLSPDSGAAYLFTLSNSIWTHAAYFKASNTGVGDIFGASVAISGDTVLVGAPWEASNATGIGGDQLDNSATDSGAAYLFTLENGDWSQTHYIKATNTEPYDTFGTCVAVEGAIAAIGAPGEDSGSQGIDSDQSSNASSNSGAVYRYANGDSGWAQASYLKASNPQEQSQFGFSLSLSGEALLTGSIKEATGGADAGAAYLFSMRDLIGVLSLTAAGATKIKPTRVRKKARALAYKITNIGNAELRLSSVALSGKHRKDFRLTGPALRTLAPGQSTTFGITFKPKAKGIRKAVVTVTSSGGNSALSLKGKGI